MAPLRQSCAPQWAAWRLALAAAFALAVLCTRGARAISEFDGIFTLGKGTLIAVNLANGQYLWMVGSPFTVATDDPLYIVPEWGFGIGRPGFPNMVESYASWSGNYTNLLSNGTGVPTTIYAFNNFSTPLYPITRTATNVSSTAPSFAGYWESSDGWRKVCLCTKRDRGACICVRNRLQSNGTVESRWNLAVQNAKAPLTANVITVYGEKDLTYTLSNNSNTLTVREAVSKKLVTTLIRTKPPVAAEAPPLTGLFRTNPAKRLMMCGSPDGTPAVALCFGTTYNFPFPNLVFNVIEVATSRSGEATELLTSRGLFTTRWSDASGAAKLQTFPGLTQVNEVWYRTANVQTLTGTWTINNVPVTCTGDFLATACVGSTTRNNVTSSITLQASGRGNGVYGVSYVMAVGSKAVSYTGLLSVSLDGTYLIGNLPVPK